MKGHRKTQIPTPGHEIRPFLLRFFGADVEHRFQVDHLVQSLPTIRTFLIAGAFLYAAFGVLDGILLSETRDTVWLIRYALVMPVLIGILILSYSNLFIRFAQICLSSVMFTAGLGVVLMTAVAEPPANGLYYAGLIMVVIYCASLIRLRWTNASLNALFLFALYQPVALWINPIPTETHISNDFFLGMCVAVGIFSSYVQELYIRREFRNAEMLRLEKEKSIELMQEAQAADRAKSEFLGVMSHELRTPLNAVIGFTEIMQKKMFGPLGSEQYIEYVNDINEAGNHLLGIISDVLEFSRAEVGKLTLQEETFRLDDILEQSCRMLRQKAAEHRLRLSLEIAPDPPELRADQRLLRQTFINLIGNAIKFTPPGGAITVSAQPQDDGSYAVTVADTGIGIAEEDLEKVLEPFAQVETAYHRQHGGTGLGLPLSKKIIEAHGGELTLQSTVGAGTSVTVILPAERILRPRETDAETA